MEKPFAPACERNRDPILAVLRERFTEPTRVLEIGSGTGQHAVYFAHHMPHLTWWPADLPERLPGIQMWTDEAALTNVAAPIALDVDMPTWPEGRYDLVFTANTVHIVSEPHVERLIAGAAGMLDAGGRLLVYGPFKYNGAHTSESNARFQEWLTDRDPQSGVRDFEWVDQLAKEAGLVLEEDIEMPANNRILIWRKAAG